jgi:hypothetical protein
VLAPALSERQLWQRSGSWWWRALCSDGLTEGRMKAVVLGACLLALVIGGCSSSGKAGITYQPADARPPMQPQRWTFDTDPAGGLPQGAAALSGTWAVRAEAEAPSPPNALCQTGTAEFPTLVLGDAVYTDVTLTARFEPISGKTDQAAGLIARVQDEDNYYILRANALEGNVNLYKYAGGKRSTLKEGTAGVSSGRWQELRLEVAGNRLRGYLNRRLVVEATDDNYRAGKVGLWTKADSTTCFDDVEARAP